MKWIILIFVITCLVYLFRPINNYYKGPISDHFDGKEFYNEKPYHKKNFLDLLRWWYSRNRHKWPSHQQNQLPSARPIIKNPTAVRLTFINHATVLIESQHFNLLTDPIWSERASPFSWLGPKRVRNPGINFDELPVIHAVVISHNHYDHLDLKTLSDLEKKFHPTFFVPLGNKQFLIKLGIKNIVELDWWQHYQLNDVIITLLPTKHWSARWLNDKYFALWGSYGIEIANKKIYFAGDTGYSDIFVKIRQQWHKPDIALLPIGSYKPEWFMKENHLDPEEAVKTHLDLQAKHSIGIHFGTFQLSDEAIDQPVKDLKQALNKHSLSDKDFIILNEGQNYQIH